MRQAGLVWQLSALFRGSTVRDRQPFGQAACFGLSVHFHSELRLSNPGSRCHAADRSGTYDPTGIVATSKLARVQPERTSIHGNIFAGTESACSRLAESAKQLK